MRIVHDARWLFPSLLGLCLTFSVASAQGPDKGKKPLEPAWGPTVEGLRMSLRSVKSDYISGEKLVVRIVLQNVDSKDREVIGAHPLQIFEFAVTRPTGKTDPIKSPDDQLFAPGGGGYVTTATLKPGEQADYKLDLIEEFDLKMPGEYRIVVSHDAWNRDDKKKFSTVTSNPLVIKITEPPAKKDK